MRKLIIVGVLAGFLFSVSYVGAAVSLGSSLDNTYLDLEPGAYGVFEASFFNMGDESLDLEFVVEYPSDLRIEVVSTRLEMGPGITPNPESSGEWLILDGGERYVRTHPVVVYVKIPSTLSRNTYQIKLIATTADSDESGGGFRQSLVQVREITFTANVPGRTQISDEVETIQVTASSGDSIRVDAEESFESNQGSNPLSYDAKSSTSGGTPVISGYSSTPSDNSNVPAASLDKPVSSKKPGLGVSKDPEGNTHINLPTGEISLTEEQTGTVIDIGLITLLISVGSLIVRIMK